jgi:serine/threonine-protein kinase
MLASGVATTAWHLGRAGGSPPDSRVAQPAGPTPAAPVSAAAGVATRPPSGAAATAANPVRRDPRGDVRPATDQHQDPVPATPTPTRSPARAGVPEAKPYGPWECQEVVHLNVGGSPVLADPCHALGSRVQMRAMIAAPTGGTGTVTLSLRDVASGRTVGGSKTCSGFTFTDRDVTRDCGPVTTNPAHGHSYVVQMSWTYVRDGRSTSGVAKGHQFVW